MWPTSPLPPVALLVFCSKTGTYLDPVSLRGIFERLLKKAGLPHMRFHDLRHTAITLMLKAGVLPHVVSDIVEHSDVSITLGVVRGSRHFSSLRISTRKTASPPL